MMSYVEIKRLAGSANVIPLYEKIAADLDTPLSAYLKVCSAASPSFLLESIEGGEKLARYSFLGGSPFESVSATDKTITVIRGRKKSVLSCEPLGWLKDYFAKYRTTHIEGLPRFTGGAVGYFSYDFVRLLERIPDRHGSSGRSPLFNLSLFRDIVVFDHVRQEIIVIANIFTDDNNRSLKSGYDNARRRLHVLTSRLSKTVSCRSAAVKSSAKVTPHMSKASFEEAVRKAKHYIKEGDIFQVVLSQRWQVRTAAKPLDVYRRLRRLNPSPYMFLLNNGNSAVIGSSPEMLTRIEQEKIETRPIAGTRPRGKNADADADLAQELLADKKELAEHTMLVDLGRNDIGRVCKPGSVRIEEPMHIEKYSHVMHLVSSVSGIMREDVSALDGLAACFPAGTVSGAPKIRAMQIIDELEPCCRGIYAGAVAYIDFWGSVDSCIAIRTVVRQGTTYTVQAGAGIVADSDPEREYLETCSKAEALFAAIRGGEPR